MFSYATTVGKQQAGSQKTVDLPSNRSSNFPSPIRARKDPSLPAKFLPLNLSLKPSATLGRSSTPTPLALENTLNYNSPIVVGCAGSKHSTITWSGIEWPLFPLGNETSIYFTTLSRVHRLRKGSTYICRRKCSTGTSADATQAPVQTALETTTHIDSSSSTLLSRR